MGAALALAAAASTALLLVPLGAASTGLQTPLGSGNAGVEVSGGPAALAYDPGTSLLPGDDTVAVTEGVRRLQVDWTGAPVGTNVEASLRGLVLEHGASSAAAKAVSQASPLVAEEARAVWVTIGPEGVDFGLRAGDMVIREGGQDPLTWPEEWYDLGWGVGYDRVTLPTAITESSDRAMGHQFHTAGVVCTASEQRWRVRPPGCDGLEATARNLLPNVILHTELKSASIQFHLLQPLPTGIPGSPGPLALAVQGGVLPGAASGRTEERMTVHGPVGAPSERTDPVPAAARAPAPSTPRAQLAAGGLVPVDSALPLAIAAVALLAPIVALYRRILPSGALQHPVREDLLHRVREHPGIHESQLAREMGLRHTHVQYHLRVLTEAGVLEIRRFGGLKCIFELGRHSPAEKAMALVERGRSREVLMAVAGTPGVAQRALARALGMSESSVKWHLGRLEGAGLVRTERARGAKRVWPAGGAVAPAPAATAPSAPATAPAPAPEPLRVPTAAPSATL